MAGNVRGEDLFESMRVGIARIMVRRHFADLIGRVGSEDAFVTLFIIISDRHKGMSNEDVANLMRRELLAWLSTRRTFNDLSTP